MLARITMPGTTLTEGSPVARAGRGRRPFRALILDDQQTDLSAMTTFLAAHLRDLEVTGIATLEDGLRALDSGKYDIIVSDYRLANGLGTELLRATASQHPDSYRILALGHTDLPVPTADPSELFAHLVLLKPLRTQPFVKLVSQILQKRTPNGR
jgi:DNA-binding NtrC family response regulator